MEWNNPFELIDLAAVEERLNVKRSTIFQRVSDGKFPGPIGGTRRACWPQLQIIDYLYQVSRYGSWSQERADNAMDSAYSMVVGLADSRASGASQISLQDGEGAAKNGK